MKKIAYQEMFENEISHAWYISTRNLLTNNLQRLIKKSDIILDAGCGTGGTLVFLKRAGFKKVEAFDYDQRAIKFSKKRGFEKVKKGSVNRIPYRNNFFDAVICLDVLCQKGVFREKAFKEFYRVLKPGGILYSQEPAYDWLKSKHDRIVQTSHRFARKELRKYVTNNNFILIRSSYLNTFLLPIILVKRILDKFFNKSKKSDVSTLPPVINSTMLAILNFEGYLIKHSVTLPFGLSVITVARKK